MKRSDKHLKKFAKSEGITLYLLSFNVKGITHLCFTSYKLSRRIFFLLLPLLLLQLCYMRSCHSTKKRRIAKKSKPMNRLKSN